MNKTGNGAVSLAAAAGVSLTKEGDFADNEEIYIRKRSANNWIVIEVPVPPSGSGGSVSSSGGYSVHAYTSGTSTFDVA